MTGAPGTALATAEEIIEEARNGRMFILVDDEDRENEGDLVIPAQMVTPESIAFMATHGRGLVCLALDPQRVDRLGLPQMSARNGTALGTAFTVSIEAREGVTTGISAADRARTIAVAIDPARTAADLVSPGHVFPLRARPGGVLVRAGHTEAAVDIARLAGLNPSGVICEIMSADGTMARLPELTAFAAAHGLRIGTIRDLIAYRRRHDRIVELRKEARFVSRHGGEWQVRAYYNTATDEENLVLIKGEVDPAAPTMVRMHTLSFFSDLLGEDDGRTYRLHRAMEMIAAHGSGVIVVLNPQERHVSRSIELRDAVRDGATQPETLRDYGVGAQILAELGVHDMILLSNAQHTLAAIEGHGLSVAEVRPITG